MKNDYGVYFLANDYAYDLAVAFLNSFRAHNPDTPLCLIPFDQRANRIAKMARAYNFTIYGDQAALSRCDEISLLFHESVRGHYRKLVMWDGPFDQFVYIDLDTIVLRSLTFVLDHLHGLDVLTSHSDIEGSRRWVWKDDTAVSAILNRRELEYAASTGFIASRRGVLTWEGITRLLPGALALKPYMELYCMEQPLLNYLIVKSTVAYSSLHLLSRQQPDAGIPHECWAGDVNWRIDINQPSYYRDRPVEVMFIHWAGQWTPVGSRRPLYNLLFRLGLTRVPTTRPDMKMKKIWSHYRKMGVPRFRTEVVERATSYSTDHLSNSTEIHVDTVPLDPVVKDDASGGAVLSNEEGK